MRKVAILIAASPTRAFYSMVAAQCVALSKLPWSDWYPSVHMYLAGEPDEDAYAEWYPYLRDVEISWVSQARFERDGDWAQSDDVFTLAPRDADVFLAMDADVLPVGGFERVLNRVVEETSIAATIAYKPFPGARTSPAESWAQVTEGLIDVPLDFKYQYTLMTPGEKGYHLAPFYPNFGVVFFPGATFDDIGRRYLELRPHLADRMDDYDFSGQVALTLAFATSGARTWPLPMRYNFPNHPIAERKYPEELRRVVMFHYLRTKYFDRHRIFTSADQYSRFLALPLEGVNKVFQRRVRRLIGRRYPFG